MASADLTYALLQANSSCFSVKRRYTGEHFTTEPGNLSGLNKKSHSGLIYATGYGLSATEKGLQLSVRSNGRNVRKLNSTRTFQVAAGSGKQGFAPNAKISKIAALRPTQQRLLKSRLNALTLAKRTATRAAKKTAGKQ
ncbi:hypothetical protein PROFUN_10115 [Planoprotostelium fungivorum]|uniref:Ribosomal eL28/Mak16 domain-containing protein n=1 Tax=Planoprotostelium fungivorum TaxID=1890364 RepID=A0A2P6NER1_9EUKA|nr:hypothetical protein PROFUN_10115 [Planoprotostelium fungivorum]